MEKVRRIPLADLKNTTNNTTNNTMGCITGEQLIVKKNLITVSASSIISTYSTAEPALFNESSSDSSNGIMHSNEREHETKQHCKFQPINYHQFVTQTLCSVVTDGTVRIGLRVDAGQRLCDSADSVVRT